MSTALFENDVTSVMKSFEYLFTTESWDQLVKHSNKFLSRLFCCIAQMSVA